MYLYVYLYILIHITDFAKQGTPTLWASFEILNEKLLEKMLRQSYRKGKRVVYLYIYLFMSLCLCIYV